MDDVLELARTLGRTMHSHARFLRLREAEAAVRADEESLKLAGALAQLDQEIEAAGASGAEIDGETRVRAERIKAAVEVDARLQELGAAQKEFQEMIDRVRETMLASLAGED